VTSGAGRAVWTETAVKALGVRTDVETAGDILGLSRTQAYEAVKAGRFPVAVLHVGRRLVVPTAPLRRLLGIDEAGPAPPAEPAVTSAAEPSATRTTTHDTTPGHAA
jgi:hypothetical protein